MILKIIKNCYALLFCILIMQMPVFGQKNISLLDFRQEAMSMGVNYPFSSLLQEQGRLICSTQTENSTNILKLKSNNKDNKNSVQFTIIKVKKEVATQNLKKHLGYDVLFSNYLLFSKVEDPYRAGYYSSNMNKPNQKMSAVVIKDSTEHTLIIELLSTGLTNQTGYYNKLYNDFQKNLKIKL